ncbi:zinc-ribbon and DUF3426 domain-containing protein [Rhodanobacter sp. AS-Z3]|uniref:zinc-ribbon and DUF3426 domain-containing protein n=1 Tax=Rhodanobacter sp. AS-Z3 TaxID=3031330 RepID=UPI002478B750|nr:zinc-ribbon and DUF3426 domain-containing protein [Rhodanobacter sp. AS-Z3]WEN15179.1 zinc-ribbon and DUF3426 domain-containing protein [Rhodanobacter sp. AS-Z3]
MYTQCPECLSVFSLDAQTIAKANGHVACSHCAASFDSLATLTEQLPPEPFVELLLNEPALEPPLLDLVVYRPKPEVPAVVELPAIAPPAMPSEDFSQLVFAPRFAQKTRTPPPAKSALGRQRRSSNDKSWPWMVACGVLTLLLAGQLGWAKRVDLIRDPLVGSWLRSTCATLGCRLPLVAAPKRLRLIASNVQAHPSVPNALMISASVSNDAAFAQPYPVLTITLSNAQGQRIAMRRLQPEEYLDDTAILRAGLPSGSSAVLLLEVEDPGKNAVAFEISFE